MKCLGQQKNKLKHYKIELTKKPLLSEWLFSCGEGGIRTPGTSQHASFQD